MAYLKEETYEAENDEGQMETRTATKLILKARKGEPQLGVGETVRLKISGDPSLWNDYQGKFTPSTLCFFELPDGTSCNAFITHNLRAQKVGVTLVQVLKTLSDGDVIDVTRVQRKVKKGKFAGTAFDLYNVKAVSVEGGAISLLAKGTTETDEEDSGN